MSDRESMLLARLATEENRRKAAEARLFKALVAVYPKHSLVIAEMCDLNLDKSGALLGRVRDAALSDTAQHDIHPSELAPWQDALDQIGIDYQEVRTQLAFHGYEIRPADTAQQETGDG